jgi:xanthine dehydrogenase YagR molybdenum-binding subunit
MEYTKPAGKNPIDRQNVVGQKLPRVDGPLKVTGAATYAYEWHDPDIDYAHGYPVFAQIPKGKIVDIDTSVAESAEGVVAVITTLEVGELEIGDYNTVALFGGDKVNHYHQAIAVVVAHTFEAARAAAALVKVRYENASGKYALKDVLNEAEIPPAEPEQDPPQTSVGDFDLAFSTAAVKVDQIYTTPDQTHAMMEPHATIALWQGDELKIWTSSQMIDWWRSDLAKTLKIDKDKIHLVSPFIGGGFGGKLFLRSDAVLASLAAKKAGCAVKLALPRPAIINNTTHRPATVQRVRIGTDAEGKITAIGHESWSGDQEDGQPELAVTQTRFLYAGENRITALRLAILDLPEGNSMRAPGDAPGMMALEIAMDELAEKLEIDPVQLRIQNDTLVDPEKPERAFSQRTLVECLRIGAERFGWAGRPEKATRRDGDQWIGYGVASAFRNHMLVKSGARVELEASGHLIVETDMTDIGTGSYTIIAQTAVEMLGLPIDQVTVRLGDSKFPVSAGSGGQFGAACATSGVFAACEKLREKILDELGINAEGAEFRNGSVTSGSRTIALSEAVKNEALKAEDKIEWGDLDKTYQLSTFGSHFVEVGVDAFTGECRIRRMLAVCSAGRILNPITARSQVIGAMTMGIGAALSEELVVDARRGFFVNHDLAGYEVPVHADIPEMEVVFLDDLDPLASPMKAKGIGELGLCGVSAAIANAIYNATGARIRDYPITSDKLIAELPRYRS